MKVSYDRLPFKVVRVLWNEGLCRDGRWQRVLCNLWEEIVTDKSFIKNCVVRGCTGQVIFKNKFDYYFTMFIWFYFGFAMIVGTTTIFLLFIYGVSLWK